MYYCVSPFKSNKAPKKLEAKMQEEIERERKGVGDWRIKPVSNTTVSKGDRKNKTLGQSGGRLDILFRGKMAYR